MGVFISGRHSSRDCSIIVLHLKAVCDGGEAEAICRVAASTHPIYGSMSSKSTRRKAYRSPIPRNLPFR